MFAEKIETEESDVSWFAKIFRGYDEFNLQKEITWDGTDSDGNVVSDGVYSVKVWVKDAAKQVTEIEVDDFVLDTKKTVSFRQKNLIHFCFRPIMTESEMF